MTEDIGPSTAPAESCSRNEPAPDTLSSQRVFKKSSANSKLTLYLSSRDLVVSEGRIDRLHGVLLLDPDFVEQRKVYGQVTLTFRYGREDEEVMGLKFCNEAVMCLAQLYPPHAQNTEHVSPLQEALLKRLGPNAYPFTMEITPLAPPSVQLVPAKEYNGAPIGTSYDVRAYIADRADEKMHRKTTVRMGIRVVQRAFAPPCPSLYNLKPGEKEKNKHKITLFGCKSAHIESKMLTASPQSKSRSANVGFELSRLRNNRGEEHSNTPRSPNNKLPSDNGDGHEIDIPKQKSEERTPTHVTFQEGLKDELCSAKPENFDNCAESPCPKSNPEPQTQEDKDAIQLEHAKNLCSGKRPSLAAFLAEVPSPQATVEKQFLLSDGRVVLEASLNKAIYYHGEEIQVTVHIRNLSSKTIKRIKVFVVQHVDVCMFSNGKFKNVVAMINSKEDCPVGSNQTLLKTYCLIPIKSSTKNWIALEDSYTKIGTCLASSVSSCNNNPEERNVFAIYVSYYVKVKLIVSVMGGEVALKLPFTLMHTCSDFDPNNTLTRVVVPSPMHQNIPQPEQELTSSPQEVKPEKDGT